MNDSAIQEILQTVRFDRDGLVPAVVQDAVTREVLTVAYMNQEALRKTLLLGETHFFSRTRQKLWHKGETSGNFQKVRTVRLDCDADTLLVEVEPMGPACHNGTYSCFNVEPGFGGTIRRLEDLVLDRKKTRPPSSYTTRLFDRGLDKIVQKVGEEAVETVIAAKNDSTARIVEETSDLLYHLVVMLVEKGVALDEIGVELSSRHRMGKKE
jgi:phosphoribosyl-ATP pyrophosphohydrolase/phosphoribosyl-AMP cyclohydrolase